MLLVCKKANLTPRFQRWAAKEWQEARKGLVASTIYFYRRELEIKGKQTQLCLILMLL